jgi:uncharacterized protein YodC (DUF2158 family)
MNQFKIGTTVRLKSGGPIMTLNNSFGDGGGTVECLWFTGSELKMGRFSPDALEQVAP